MPLSLVQASKIARALREKQAFWQKQSLGPLVTDREVESRPQIWGKSSSNHSEQQAGGSKDVSSDEAGA